MRLSVLVLATSLACMNPLHGQEPLEVSNDAEILFRKGLGLFEAQRYTEAIATFNTIVQQYPKSHRITAALVMKAKGLFYVDETLQSARELKSLLANYPSSTYAADAEFTLGLINYRLERFDDAAESFLIAWRKAARVPQSERLMREITDALDLTIDRRLPVSSVQRLLGESRTRAESAFLWLKLGEKEAARGNIIGAAIALDTLTAGYPEAEYRDRRAALQAEITQRSAVKLGALLPLMKKSDQSPAKRIGAEIEEGIRCALDEHAKRPGAKMTVKLEVRDTERDPLTAMRGAQELASDDNILAIVGPVFSNTTTAVSELTNRRRVPLITPTANSNGIAAVGDYVFQANPDYENRGRAMAQFAVRTKGFKTFAVLAPAEGHGRSMGEAFVSEAIRLGGKVVATEWYPRGLTDLQPQLTNIRRAGYIETADPMISFAGRLSSSDIAKFVQLGVSPKKIDSLAEREASIPASVLIGPGAKQKIDSLGIRVTYNTAEMDSLVYPVSAIEAIYMPISSPDEIGVLSAQLVYYNLQTQVLGGGEWNDLAELDAQRRYCSGVVFESDTYVDEQSQPYTEFSNRFFEQFGKRPTKYTLYGYDTTELLLDRIQAGGTSRDGLARLLASTREYQGVHSKIGFGTRRVNTWLHVLQYTGETIQKIAEVNVE